MSIAYQAFLVQAMSGKNVHTVNPVYANNPKNVKSANNVSSIDVVASPAQDPKGIIDGSTPIEGTNLGINI